MHASYQIINQILQLAYITHACILNLRTYAMQASTWICTYQMQSIKVHELAPPTCVLLLSKNFDPSLFFNVAPFLSMSMSNLYFFVSISSKVFHILSLPLIHSQSQGFHIFVQSLPPLSSISIKGMLLIDAKVCIWGRLLRLESCIFYGHHLIVGMTPLVDTTCNLYHLYLV